MTGNNILKGLSVRHLILASSLHPTKGVEALDEYLMFVNSLAENNGIVTTVKVMKDLNSRSRHYVAGHPKGANDIGGIWFKIDKKSFLPRKLGRLRSYLDLEPNIALSIPNLVYLMRLKPDTDLSSVTDPPQVANDKRRYKAFARFCQASLPRLKLGDVPVRSSTKSGPNGPAFCTQAQDLISLELTKIKGFECHFLQICEEMYGQNWLYKSYAEMSLFMLQEGANLPVSFKDTPRLARLIFLSAPAGKTRIVYVLNWWIQMLLLPIHDSMMEFFKNYEGDSTWDQDKAIADIRQWSLNKEELYSFDLTAATDRWPVKHQSCVIDALFGSKIGQIWYNLMTGIVPYVKEVDNYVPYSVGQPMGAFSSWAALNMSHHTVIRFIATNLGLKNPGSLYKVLGDDVVIRNRQLAYYYERYMKNALGVQINDKKSLIHCKGLPHSAEFARHIVRDGINVGTISPNLLKEVFEDHMWWKQLEILREFKNKLDLSILVSPDAIAVPARIDRLLREKDKLFEIICFPEEVLNLPVIRIISAEELGPEFVKYPNPYSGLPERYLDAVISQRLRGRAIQRLQDITDLDNQLSEGKINLLPLHLLECESHPIRVMVSDLNKDMILAYGRIHNPSFRNELSLTTLSCDLLIDVLVKGKSFKDWKDKKQEKEKTICNFVRSIQPQVLSWISFEKSKPSTVITWESYEAAWESQANG